MPGEENDSSFTPKLNVCKYTEVHLRKRLSKNGK